MEFIGKRNTLLWGENQLNLSLADNRETLFQNAPVGETDKV